ncbi:MAG TPA: cellulase family glycosylhydrolase [Nevskiaceae bacterium]|nr:cellulase family glycosylhydrolase [Nevskiaceae bacterium]
MKRLVIAAIAAMLCACGGAATSPAVSAPAARQLPLLHAVRGTAPGIYDDSNRQVILRGVNYNALGDYYQDNPLYPPVILPRASDFPRMAGIGLNSVRLIVHWSRIEPQPGIYDTAYLALIQQQIEQAAASGLYVIVDMHQDAWGKYVASREAGDSCLPPLAAAIGWDGAPQWATLTDGLTTCRVQQREIAPAVQAAFENFYLDTQGVQTQFVSAWQVLASAVARYPNVAGYDLFNEPSPGFAIGANNLTLLSALYGKLVTTIRAAESAQHAPAHIVFFEPPGEWSIAGFTVTPPPTFTADDNIVFAPHLYCGESGQTPTADCFRFAALTASLYQSTFWVGEWGYFGDPSTLADPDAAFAAQEDASLVGSSLWQWQQACGDPHTIGTPGGTPAATVTQLLLVGCPGDVDLGFVDAHRLTLSRTYPRYAPGALTQISSDIASGAATIAGNGSGTLELWVPARIGSPQVSGGDAAVGSVDGGFIVRVPVSGSYSVQLTPR